MQPPLAQSWIYVPVFNGILATGQVSLRLQLSSIKDTSHNLSVHEMYEIQRKSSRQTREFIPEDNACG
eukprot:2622808-Amphidinium_carterae.2